MKKLLVIFFVLNGFLLGQSGASFSADSLWTKRNGDRFFGMTVNLNGLRDSALNSKTCSEDAFDVIKEIFNLQYQHYISSSSVLPYIDLGTSSENAFLTGPSRIHYELRKNPLINTESFDPSNPDTLLKGYDYIGPADQRNAVSNLTDSLKYHILDTLIKQPCETRGDFVFFVMDEPEWGQGSWYFNNNLLEEFHKLRDTIAPNTFTYLDLAAMRGSKIIYDQVHNLAEPANNLQKYNTGSWSRSVDNVSGIAVNDYSDFKKTVQYTADYYRDACDVMGINTYQETAANPYLLGEAVEWIRDTVDKPVWPWVSPLEQYYSGASALEIGNLIRQQCYSAVAHRASGLMFWTDRDVPEDTWDATLDVAKEFALFRVVLEQNSNFDWNPSTAPSQTDFHWRTVKWGNRYFLFGYNRSDSNSPKRTIAQFTSLTDSDTVRAKECGVWTSLGNNTPVKKLTSPKNLGFENNLKSYSSKWEAYDNWYLQNALINSFPTNAKTGRKSLRMTDFSSTKIYSAEQIVECVPGASYELQAWARRSSGPNKQYIYLQFYSDSEGWLSEVGDSTELTTNDWELLKVEGTADTNATFIKICILSGKTGNDSTYRSNYYWDDVFLKMTGYNGINKPSLVEPKRNENLSHEFNLCQNFPNPFNPSTKISYSIPTRSYVTLKIYDILGNEISTLVNSTKERGIYEADFDATKLASGVYIYSLKAGNMVKNRKMMLIK